LPPDLSLDFVRILAEQSQSDLANVPREPFALPYRDDMSIAIG
jgi:hypothetical protein